MSRKIRGFTLVEIMIVVAIIGLLAAIALPSFMKARASARRNACINNLKQIDGAKDEYCLEYGGTNLQMLVWQGQVSLYVKDFSNKMFCPAGKVGTGTGRSWSNYNLRAVGIDPECLILSGNTTTPEHSLKFKAK